MNTYYDEALGFEPILPIEIIDLLNINKASAIDVRTYESISTTQSYLDEHELAMAV
ncbi:MAG: hypothetical protein KAR12_02625 [Methylococcales bacterium]|nr:hypothetical protein [Methylococcales bacterium]